MKRKVNVIVEGGGGGFSCFMDKETDDLPFGLCGTGKSAREAMDDFMEAEKLMREYYADEGKEFPGLEYNFLFDVGAFFDYYPLNITACARAIGMNASLLRQYAKGIKTPRQKNLDRIREGMTALVRSIDPGRMIDRPALEYA